MQQAHHAKIQATRKALEAEAGSVFMIVWLTFWSFGVYFLLTKGWQLWREAIRGKHAMIIPALVLTAFATPFVGAEVFVLGMLLGLGSQLLVVMPLIYAGINYGFYLWLKAPTHAGKKLYDALAGFRIFERAGERIIGWRWRWIFRRGRRGRGGW